MNENLYIKAIEYYREQNKKNPLLMSMDNTLNYVRRNSRNSFPELLSHYCTADTAIKIFENCIMWLTDVRKMNDESELIYAIESLKSAVAKLDIHDSKYKGLQDIVLEDMNTLLSLSVNLPEFELPSIRNKIVMATCFSIHHDDANMWRLYGENASGVEIQFNSRVLADMIGNYGVFIPNSGNYETGFVKVCYEGGSCDCLQNFANQIIDAYKYVVSENEKSILRNIIYYSISDFLMSHKHHSFIGEGEYRLFTHIPINKTWSGSDYLFNHPNGKTQYTPLAFGAYAIGYYGLEDFLPNLIQSINFGPHMSIEKIEMLEQRLSELGLKNKLNKSTIPIRKL